jgi:FG-GAP-like repeat
MKKTVCSPIVIGLLGFVLLVLPASVLGQVGPDALRLCRDFGFSTEEDFITQGPEPPDGNPIISDGDLLGPDCVICARNTDLLQIFNIRPGHDLGLDAVHVIDTELYLVVFSTELDSPDLGQFTQGDLLATNGAIIPNSALMYQVLMNLPVFFRVDLGIDGVQLVGDPGRIIDFLNYAATIPRIIWLNEPELLARELNERGIDILFSTEGTGPTPDSPGFLDGDILSAATGTIVAANSMLLPNSVPAGIPTRGVDFGLDALNLNPLDPENILLTLFSTELLYRNEPEFTGGDVLQFANGVATPNSDLVKCFEPRADFLGLDALFRNMTINDMQSLLSVITSSDKQAPANRMSQNESISSSTEARSAILSLQLDKCMDLAFSTEEDFITQGPVPPDGNPIISDGDLLGSDGAICARNRDLVGLFDVTEDLGLDAVDIINMDSGLVAFSTELDSPHNSPPTIHFTAGDLLATNGVIIPNIALTYLFNIVLSLGYDIGLDGVHFVGDEERIIGFLNEARGLGREYFITDPGALSGMLRQWGLDIWFSTEGTGPIPTNPGFLDGDLLSARDGTIVVSNSSLLPNSVPAGIPSRGVDFGLDAVAGDREEYRERIGFSTEILYTGEPDFTDGDVLLAGNGVIRTNNDLITAFEPRTDFLGLDALSMAIRKPDLVITRIHCDSPNRRIGYEVKNIGFATAPLNHNTMLLVPDPAGGILSFHDLVPVTLNPGDTHEGWFSVPDSIWPPCENLQITVCADSSDVLSDDNLVDELNEYNNCNKGECLFAELEWTWNSTTVEPTYDQVMMAPVAADLNGDYIPDIIFSTFDAASGWLAGGILRAISGDGSGELFSVTDPAYRVQAGAEPAVADIDNDGKPEVLVSKQTGEIICFEHDGAFKWVSTGYTPGRVAIAVADLDQDGTPEIISGRTVLNNNGTNRWSGTGGSNYVTIVADLDLDGSPEVIAGSTAYRYDGTVYWSGSPAGKPAIGNFDNDAYPEVVLVGSDEVNLKEHDGTLKWGPVAIPAGGAGPPVVADMDGDGEPEIGVGGYDYYVAFETNGTIKWMADIRDYSSQSAGSSAFDFDGDGRFEIVYSDERFHRIFRGINGDVLFETPGRSGTLIEQPVIVDADNDGHVEVVFAVNNYGNPASNTGIEVYGNDECWPAARRIWNQHSYHVTNVNDDASIPHFEANSWEFLNHYRTQSPADVCKADFDKDGDVDGSDLATFAGGSTGITLGEFAAEFGRTDCP